MLPDDHNAPIGRVPAWAVWARSVINAAIGDYLHNQHNGLTIAMAFYHQQQPLTLTPEAILLAHPHPTAKLCILVHGLGCHEGIWGFPDPTQPQQTTSYGQMLQAELGYTPLYVRYNTGLPLAENGRSLAALLDELLASYPLPIEEIMLIGHSMGGLVIRSACAAASQGQSPWITQLRRVFYLGTPHDGADLAQLGYVATTVLHAVPNPITRLIGDIFNLRSQGVKDLRAGRPLGAKPLNGASDDVDIPWLETAHHYLIVGTLTHDPNHLATVFFGDGLVRLPGTWPVHGDNVKVFPQVHHLRLAYDPDIYQQIKLWCAEA